MTIFLVNNVVMQSKLDADTLHELHHEWQCRSNEAQAKDRRLVAAHQERMWRAARQKKPFLEDQPSGYACDEEVGAFWQWLICQQHAEMMDVPRFEA